MALIDVQLTVRMKDINNDTTPQQVYFEVDDTKTIAQLNTAIGIFLGTLDTVVDPIIDQVLAKLVVPISGLKSSPGPDTISDGALFTYLLDTGADSAIRSYGQNTPGWARAKITAGGQVDVADSTVQTYYRYWTSGPIANLSAFKSNDWVSLLEPERVKLNTRKHRREQQRINEEAVAP